MLLLQVFVSIYGAITVCVSIYLACSFWRSEEEVGAAMAYMLIGESITNVTTVAFAVITLSKIGRPSAMTEVSLRFIIFSATMGSSLHLFHVIRARRNRETLKDYERSYIANRLMAHLDRIEGVIDED